MAVATAETAPVSSTSERISICGSRYELFTGTVLPNLNSPSARAFAAQATRGGTPVVAYIPALNDFPRLELAGSAGNINSVGVLRFLEYDTVYWSEYRRHVPVLLFERPVGLRIMDTLQEERTPLHSEIIFRQYVESLYEGLRDMYLSGITHGCINPTNIFARDAAGTSLQLGEYLCAPAGKYQHIAFETIERALAQPVARGTATAADDIYALGVTLLMFIFGRLPLLQQSPEEIIETKIEKGSLMALIGGLRLPAAYSEIMRGLLSDDPNQRWNMEDIDHWIGGRRMGSKAGAQIRKAQRGFDFMGKTHTNVRLLAHSMALAPDHAARLIEDESLDRWIKRSLNDEAKAIMVQEAVATATAAQRGGSTAERAVARVAITLDPAAPIRFRDIRAMPNGIGALLAEQLATGQQPRNVADLIAAQLVIHWVNMQGNFNGDNTSLLQTYEGLRVLLDRPQPGFGIERVLYDLNPYLPCISPMVGHFYPHSLKALAIAIEAVAGTPEAPREPIDRHIAAFVLSRHRRMNDRLFPLLAPNVDSGQRIVAMLAILSEVQRKYNPEPMPKTAEWLARLLTPSMEKFHNIPLRDRVMRDVRKLAKEGELDEILAIIDDGNMQQDDEEGFAKAKQEWAYWEGEAKDLSGANQARIRTLMTQGRQVTAFFAAMIGLSALAITIFLKVI